MNSATSSLLAILIAVMFTLSCSKSELIDTSVCSTDIASSQYTQYVEPFVSGAVPSACTECHMTGIDISMYAQDTPCQTFSCMVEAGAVDTEDPSGSQILEHILMGDPNSSVYDVNQEYSAMLDWIEWSSTCSEILCEPLEDSCSAGTGAATTGVIPTGDCTEDDLLAMFWDAVIIDKGRCDTCHSQWAEDAGTFGTCEEDSDCMNDLDCLDGRCRRSGAYNAPNFFESGEGELSWSDPESRNRGLMTMYNIISLGFVDLDAPMNSSLLTKPLLEGFQPTAVYGNRVSVEAVEAPDGIGVSHGGSSKFNFGCMEPPCPTSGVVDCRIQSNCDSSDECDDGMSCSEGFCRIEGSYCDETYKNYVRFVEYFAECAN